VSSELRVHVFCELRLYGVIGSSLAAASTRAPNSPPPRWALTPA